MRKLNFAHFDVEKEILDKNVCVCFTVQLAKRLK